MRISILFLTFTCASLLACSNNKDDRNTSIKEVNADSAHASLPETSTNTNLTIPKFVVDDYPVTNTMFGDVREIRIGDIRSLDKVWFTNDSLQETLVFELYTDNHRLTTYHSTIRIFLPG